MALRYASLDRATSVSSTRRIKKPPSWRAKSQLKRAVLTPPMCRYPVGLGANLVLTNRTLPVLEADAERGHTDDQGQDDIFVVNKGREQNHAGQ